MSKLRALDAAKQRMRDRAEHYLLEDSLIKLRNNAPSTVAPYRDKREGLFWRGVFVPLYTRIPWTYKQRAMEAARMTARGWTPPKREWGEPWKPPAPKP
jgi:hypothetical protein